MNREELAQALTGSEYPFEPPKELQRAAKEAGLVIVFGASDDLMEFRGAVYDEVGAYGGGIAHFTSAGLLTTECESECCPYFARTLKAAAKVKAVWGDRGYSWTFETEIPHSTFEVVEDGELYCCGIVFALSDVREGASRG